MRNFRSRTRRRPRPRIRSRGGLSPDRTYETHGIYMLGLIGSP